MVSAAQLYDTAPIGDRIRTTNASVEMRFHTAAIERLGTNAAVTVDRQCLKLQQGKILMNGAIDACFGNFRASVRGTIYTLEVKETGEKDVGVFDGQVALLHKQKSWATVDVG